MPKTELPIGQILIGDARTRLKELPPQSIDCCITSPPYYQLRDYGQKEQLGLESTVDAWAANLAGVCEDIARVLKPTGALFLNVGDQYSSHIGQGAAFKSLLLGPQRVALELAKRGWVIRNQIIWAKKNPLPSSVSDRFTSSYEVMLFCVRSRFYHFDLDAVREPHVTPPQPKRPKSLGYQYLPKHAVPEGGLIDLNRGLGALKARGLVGHPLGGNPRDVWHLATAAYHGAHFATFPIALVEKPLLATCPEKVCTACGTPWKRRSADRTRKPAVLGVLVPRCECPADAEPGVVLDPFLGAGTTALAAEMHGRRWIGVELNPVYAELANQRLAEWREQKASQP
ncbi:DNA-methyltransferase [Allorhizocola rhizosphaerae]|uniref:DNA-methyltransferase n=1 Tax=Allorhizocola rhizosphaerae TaxID=1872709 RepID=UPI000E3C2480|nr:site-specific DNA-methyltransferase [Allorhizocola rhizosphaerae]